MMCNFSANSTGFEAWKPAIFGRSVMRKEISINVEKTIVHWIDSPVGRPSTGIAMSSKGPAEA